MMGPGCAAGERTAGLGSRMRSSCDRQILCGNCGRLHMLSFGLSMEMESFHDAGSAAALIEFV